MFCPDLQIQMLTVFSEIIQKYDLFKNSIYVMGDCSINLLEPTAFLLIYLELLLIWHIYFKPTRVPVTSKTLNDNIYANTL